MQPTAGEANVDELYVSAIGVQPYKPKIWGDTVAFFDATGSDVQTWDLVTVNVLTKQAQKMGHGVSDYLEIHIDAQYLLWSERQVATGPGTSEGPERVHLLDRITGNTRMLREAQRGKESYVGLSVSNGKVAWGHCVAEKGGCRIEIIDLASGDEIDMTDFGTHFEPVIADDWVAWTEGQEEGASAGITAANWRTKEERSVLAPLGTPQHPGRSGGIRPLVIGGGFLTWKSDQSTGADRGLPVYDIGGNALLHVRADLDEAIPVYIKDGVLCLRGLFHGGGPGGEPLPSKTIFVSLS